MTVNDQVLGLSEMTSTEALNPKHLRASGVLSILGLLLIALSLAWEHPISAYVIIYIGGGLVLAGAGVFLYSFITHFLTRRRM